MNWKRCFSIIFSGLVIFMSNACTSTAVPTPIFPSDVPVTFTPSLPTSSPIPPSPTEVMITVTSTPSPVVTPRIQAENLEKLSVRYRTSAFKFYDTSGVFFTPQNDLIVFSQFPDKNDTRGVVALSLKDFQEQFSIPYLILRNAKIGLSVDGKRLAGSGYYHGKTQRLYVYNVESSKIEFESQEVWQADISVTRWSPNDLWLATGAIDGLVTVHSSKDYQILLKHKFSKNRLVDIDFSPDSEWMAVGGGESAVYIWNTANWDKSPLRLSLSASVRALRFSPDGSLLAIATPEKLFFFEVPTWKPVSPITLKEYFSALSFSPDGSLLAAGTNNGRILFWRTDTWQKLLELQEHKTRIAHLSFSPDTTHFASISISTFDPLEKDPSRQGKKSELIIWSISSP